MSTTTGRNKVCDICGKTVFEEYTGTEYTDGGFGRNNHFDTSKEEGWEHIYDLGDLCPDCAKAYHMMVDSFIEERGGGVPE